MNLLMQEMPRRCFDVGIAEGHAVTFSAGLAAAGMVPFCNIYSTFMQRAHDNVIHDVAIQGLPGGDVPRPGRPRRASDGVTHHGLFDMAAFAAVPGLTIAAPMDERELRNPDVHGAPCRQALHDPLSAREAAPAARRGKRHAFRDAARRPGSRLRRQRRRAADPSARRATPMLGRRAGRSRRHERRLLRPALVKPSTEELYSTSVGRTFRRVVTVEDDAFAAA